MDDNLSLMQCHQKDNTKVRDFVKNAPTLNTNKFLDNFNKDLSYVERGQPNHIDIFNRRKIIEWEEEKRIVFLEKISSIKIIIQIILGLIAGTFLAVASFVTMLILIGDSKNANEIILLIALIIPLVIFIGVILITIFNTFTSNAIIFDIKAKQCLFEKRGFRVKTSIAKFSDIKSIVLSRDVNSNQDNEDVSYYCRILIKMVDEKAKTKTYEEVTKSQAYDSNAQISYDLTFPIAKQLANVLGVELEEGEDPSKYNNRIK